MQKHTLGNTHTRTQCGHSYPHPSTDGYIKQDCRVMCTNYTYSIKPAAEGKKISREENPRQQPDRTRTWWKANGPLTAEGNSNWMQHFYPTQEEIKVLCDYSFLSKYESGVSGGQTDHFEPAHYTNYSVCVCRLRSSVLHFGLPLCCWTNKRLCPAPTEGGK